MAKKGYVYKDGTIKQINSANEIPLFGVVCYVDENGRYFEEKVDENVFMNMLFADDFGASPKATADVVSITYLSELQVFQKVHALKVREKERAESVDRPRRRLM